MWLPALILTIVLATGPLTETLTSIHSFLTQADCIDWLEKNKESNKVEFENIKAHEKFEHPEALDIQIVEGCQQGQGGTIIPLTKK